MNRKANRTNSGESVRVREQGGGSGRRAGGGGACGHAGVGHGVGAKVLLCFQSPGVSIDMESQYKAAGSDEWGEIRRVDALGLLAASNKSSAAKRVPGQACPTKERLSSIEVTGWTPELQSVSLQPRKTNFPQHPYLRDARRQKHAAAVRFES